MITEVRRVARDLYPVVLEKKRLGEAMLWYAHKLQTELGLQFDIQVDCPDELQATTKQHMFRIFQECVGNIVRHAEATLVKVSLQADDKQLALEIVDNGHGFNVHNVESSSCESLGLTSIRERVKLLGGFARIRSDVKHGTSVSVGIPIKNCRLEAADEDSRRPGR